MEWNEVKNHKYKLELENMPEVELTEMDKITIKQKIKDLKLQLKQEKKRNFIQLYNILSQLLEEEKKLNSKYTVRQLALDNNMNEVTVYRILCYRYANEMTKQLVETEKIDPSKVCRILCNEKRRDRQDDLVDKTIKNQYSYKELAGKIDEKIIKKRKIKNIWNIYRDLNVYSKKFLATLPLINKIPTKKRKVLLKILIKVRNAINKAIKKLK